MFHRMGFLTCGKERTAAPYHLGPLDAASNAMLRMDEIRHRLGVGVSRVEELLLRRELGTLEGCIELTTKTGECRPQIIEGRREAMRHAIRAAGALSRFKAIGATSTPQNVGTYDEILSMQPGAIDTRAAATVLFNHDRDKPIGGITGVSPDGEKLLCEFELSPEAETENGARLAKHVERGWLRGVSIGYSYSAADCDLKVESGRTIVTVRKWMLRELSITPVQLDLACVVID